MVIIPVLAQTIEILVPEGKGVNILEPNDDGPNFQQLAGECAINIWGIGQIRW